MTFLDLQTLCMIIILGFLQTRHLSFQKLGPTMVFLISDIKERKYGIQFAKDAKSLSFKELKRKIKEKIIEKY